MGVRIAPWGCKEDEKNFVSLGSLTEEQPVVARRTGVRLTLKGWYKSSVA